jgi:hypothetical protein
VEIADIYREASCRIVTYALVLLHSNYQPPLTQSLWVTGASTSSRAGKGNGTDAPVLSRAAWAGGSMLRGAAWAVGSMTYKSNNVRRLRRSLDLLVITARKRTGVKFNKSSQCWCHRQGAAPSKGRCRCKGRTNHETSKGNQKLRLNLK